MDHRNRVAIPDLAITTGIPSDDRVRSAFDESEIWPDTFRQVKSAKVAWLNEDLFTDASGMHGQMPLSRDDWIACLEEMGMLSLAQLEGDMAEGHIAAEDKEFRGFRPPRYGRAAIIPLANPFAPTGAREYFWFDVKGCGVATGTLPEPTMHRTGLLPLREAFREVILQRMIDGLFARLGIPVRGLRVYAILSLGFRAKAYSGGVETAAILLRQCHRRPPSNNEIDPLFSDRHRMKLFIELMLRQFGLTSANPLGRLNFQRGEDGKLATFFGTRPMSLSHGYDLESLVEAAGIEVPAEFDVVNVQLARDCDYASKRATIVDFGHYFTSKPKFEHPIVHLVSDQRWNWGGVYDPSSASWVQPIPELIVDLDYLGLCPPPDEIYEPYGGPSYDYAHGLTLIARRLARDAATGRSNLRNAIDEVESVVAQATRRWDKLPSYHFDFSGIAP